ncbi:MAG: DNA-protecting protein DprA [Oscillospiraceae bacterium]|jgi:DNA processing protein|nr:DNA-protecting protein DprA [Oscillospiraceae bacterium]MCI8714625.1 DNA-protecting protein DprA [Oscillospiraceae bacterium]MCI9318091.1 DNA-protecting protein DprA [Oscillospiraceae bacterium]MDE6933993.1 DNA-processing protein DprA [Oscillospiraceae bacterium]
MASLKYWLWLSSLPKVSLRMKHVLLDAFETPEKIYFSESGEYSLVEGITRPVIAALEEGRSLDGADRILGDCERLGLRVLTIQDTEYPDRLRNICDPPLLLYVQGRMPLFDDEVAVAMVGTRRTSPYAAAMGEKLAYQMAGLGAVIVSGLAAGGDASAHRGALRAGGLTVGVIAGGHDIVYPRENRWLYQDIGVRGAILSEYPPGTDHRAGHFPERNRIISGLSLGVVVIEAPERSGALITASRALDQGRDVFVLPGQADDWHCTGSNQLLRDGAVPAMDAWDVLSHYTARYPHRIRSLRLEEPRRFGGDAPPRREARQKAPPEPALPVLDLSGDHGLTDDQLRIVRALRERTVQVDELIEETQIPTRRVLSALTILELDKIVTQESGKRFSLAVTLK